LYALGVEYFPLSESNEEWIRLMKMNGLLPFDSDKSKIQDDDSEIEEE
jgi:hypothetical protein